VRDGDTIVVGDRPIRLDEFNYPETRTDLGKDAKAAISARQRSVFAASTCVALDLKACNDLLAVEYQVQSAAIVIILGLRAVDGG
jgi:endonuclease YncB( thermonuclease family)